MKSSLTLTWRTGSPGLVTPIIWPAFSEPAERRPMPSLPLNWSKSMFATSSCVLVERSIFGLGMSRIASKSGVILSDMSSGSIPAIPLIADV